MSQQKDQHCLYEKLDCIDYAIDCITTEKYQNLLLNIHKFIDTRLDNSIKNIYEKYSLSSYTDIRSEETLTHYKERLESIKSSGNNMQKAMINFLLNDINIYEETIQFFEEAKSENSFIATIFLAITYARREDFWEAIKELEKSELNNSYIFVYIGILRHNQNLNCEEKIPEYLSQDKSWKYHLNNAILLRILDKDDDALLQLNQINLKDVQDDSDRYLFWVSYSVSYLKQRKVKEAISYVDKALDLNVDTFEAQRIKAICWSMSGENIKQEKAIRVFEKLSNKHHLDNDIHRNIAISCTNQYIHTKITDITTIQKEHIIDTFKLSIRYNPFHAPNYFDFATFYYEQGLFTEAVKYYAKAIQYASYKLRYYCAYAKAFYQSKECVDEGNIAPLDEKVTEILATYADKKLYSEEVKFYVILVEIKAKCLIHKYLKNAIKTDTVSAEINTLTANLYELFSRFKDNRLDIQTQQSIHKTTFLLENYRADLKTINFEHTNIITINNLVDIKLEIKNSCLFRGMNRASWEMKPNVFRTPHPDSQFTTLENFKREAIGVSHKNYDHYTTIDWLGLMQHHGSLTELLDWTQSFSIALFFAIHLDNPSDTNQYGIPCIYTLQYKKIISMEEIEQLVKHDYQNEHSVPLVSNDKPNGPKNIVVFAPKISHKRADIQKSMFTYHRSDINIEDESDFIIKKHVISPLLLKIIKKTLEKDHINIATVYPDLQNLSKRLRNQKNINNLDFS